MCILIVKKAGAVMPSKETLEQCFKRNPDGSGFMWLREDTQMEGYKGFMNFKDFWKAISKMDFKEKDTVFIHHRITSHGGTSQQNCHPFPISIKDEDLTALHFISPVAMAHNGIIDGMPDMKHLSDTQMFIKLVLADPTVLNNLDSSGVNYLINTAVEGSRVAIMNRGKMYLYGRFEDVNGILYSNSSYKPFEYPVYKGKYKGLSTSSKCNFTDYDEKWDDEKYWQSLDEQGVRSDLVLTPIEDLKQEIYDSLIDGSCLDWVETLMSDKDCDLLHDLEYEFCELAYTAPEHRWYSLFGQVWQDVVEGGRL